MNAEDNIEPRGTDAGVTLIELLMAITISGIILVTLGFAVTQGFRNATISKASIDRSILGNFAARYFSADIASTTYGTGSIVTVAPKPCATGTGVTTIIDIQTTATSAVSYATVLLPGGAMSLIRASCSGSVNPLVPAALVRTGQVHIGTTDGTLTATPGTECTTSPSPPSVSTRCSLTLQWHQPDYQLVLSGTRWVNATTTTTP